MGEFEKHIRIAKEKLTVTKEASAGKNNTVVGDLATKVVTFIFSEARFGIKIDE